MRRFVIVVALTLFLTSCRKDVDEIIDQINQIPVGPFKVYVDERGFEHAAIHWDGQTLANPDSVTYSIELNGDTILSGLDTLAYRLENLDSRAYSGHVIAYGPGKSTFAAPFELPAINGFYYSHDDYRLYKSGLSTPYLPGWDAVLGAVDRYTASLPHISGDTIFMASNQVFHAVDKRTGQEFWRTDIRGITGHFEYTPGKVYLTTKGNSIEGPALMALNTSSHEVEWQINLPIETVITSPVISNGTIYFAASRRLYAVHLNGEIKWEKAIDNGWGTTYVYADDKHVYYTDVNGINCAEQSSGIVKWSKARWVTEPDYVSVYKGVVFPLVHDDPYAVDVETGTVLWEYNHLPTVFSTCSPVFKGDTAIFAFYQSNSTNARLTAFNYKTGDVWWSKEVAGFINHLLLVKNTLYASRRDPGEMMFEMDASNGSAHRTIEFGLGHEFLGVIEIDGVIYHTNTRKTVSY